GIGVVAEDRDLRTDRPGGGTGARGCERGRDEVGQGAGGFGGIRLDRREAVEGLAGLAVAGGLALPDRPPTAGFEATAHRLGGAREAGRPREVARVRLAYHHPVGVEIAIDLRLAASELRHAVAIASGRRHVGELAPGRRIAGAEGDLSLQRLATRD